VLAGLADTLASFDGTAGILRHQSVRWWSPDEVRAAPADCFEPAFGRFTAKLATRNRS